MMTTSRLFVIRSGQCPCYILHKRSNFRSLRSAFVSYVFISNGRTPRVSSVLQSNRSITRCFSMGHVLSDKTQLPPVPSQKKKWKQSELEMLKRQKYIDNVLYGPILNKNHGKKEHNNSPWIAPASSAAQVKDNSAEKSQTFTSEKTVNNDHNKDNTDSVDPFAGDVPSEAEKPKIDLGNMDSIFLFPLFPPPNSKNHGFGHFQTAEELAIPGVTDTMTRLPSVTSILSKTMSPEARFFLDRWEKEMIAELGEDGFAKYKKGMRVIMFD